MKNVARRVCEIISENSAVGNNLAEQWASIIFKNVLPTIDTQFCCETNL